MNKNMFYIKKLLKDFTSPLKYDIAVSVSEEIKEYYFLFDEEKLMAGGSQEFHFDSDGIPIIPQYIDIRDNTSSQYHYFPISIGQYGLAIYHTFLEDSSLENKERFLAIARWFLNNQNTNGAWEASVPVPKFKLESGWISSMAQSRGISILLRAYNITKDKIFLEKAERALKLFDVDISNGGVKSKYKDYIFYEEYPSLPKAPHVLNGHIFALFGLHEFGRFGNSKATKLFEIGLETVVKTLEEYDCGFWSKYDLADKVFRNRNINMCTAHYHNIHIKQLEVLFKISGNKVIGSYILKWKGYEGKKLNLIKSYLVKFNYLKQVNKVSK